MASVSVIIPVFNAEKTIERALDSVLAQSFSDLEVIAVDDGSTDRSRAILDRYHGRISVFEQRNRGPSAARNLGIAHSSGEYLGFLDADDWWTPGMLARMVPTLDADSEAVMAYCDLEIVDATGGTLNTSLVGARPATPPTLDDMLTALWPIMPSSVVMRRTALAAAGGWPEQLRAFEDVYLWLLLREHGSFIYVPEPLAAWRFAHYPVALKPAGGQERAGRVFRRMVKERYGVDPVRHVQGRRRAPRSILGYIGLSALAAGDRTRARRALLFALKFDPFRVKNYLRLGKTFLPDAMARRLSGRAGSSQAGN
ncbi:MAG TPA: glycosyltransferase [Candidatus Binataceae bacterium]|nr:glycosyltransferase [Candidatus Binataceae bacterium]